MTLKQDTLPNGRSVVVGGRRLPAKKFKGPRFGEAVKVASLPVPPEWNWNPSNSSLNAQGQGNILANDQYGDCFWAAMAHILDSERAASGNPYTPIQKEQVLEAYSAGTGFNVATGANDNGTDIAEGLNFCRDKGFFKDGSGKIVGYAQVDATKIAEVKTAAWLFGDLVGGFCVPDSYMDNLTRWGLAGPGNQDAGHAVGSPEGGYNSKSLLWNSWGYIVPMDWVAVQYYFSPAHLGELFVVFTEDGLNKASGKAPNGFDAEALRTYLKDF